ncbi:putative selenate ABC transporter substrate-binding protein [Flavobacteriaceae bacterium MHTCC 0001]
MKKLFILLLIICCFSCNTKADKIVEPDKLVIGFVPSEEAERMVTNLEPVTNYLSKKINIPVKLYKGNDYTAIIEAMRAEKLDIALFGPFSYVLASKRANAEPLVVPASREGKPATYNSLIIAHKKTGITNIQQLIDTPDRFSLSFSDPASTSGHLLPRGHLISLGIKPEIHFKNILFSGSHPSTILALATEKVDIAGCSFTVFNKMIERGMLKKEDITILWKSQDLPVDLVTIRSSIPSELKTTIKDAYVNMANEAPETAGYFYEKWKDSTLTYIPAKDKMYSEIRRFADFLENDLNN